MERSQVIHWPGFEWFPFNPNVGIDEAIQGGKEIAHLEIDEVHTSTLIRAQMTAMLALAQHNGGKTPVFQYSQPVS